MQSKTSDVIPHNKERKWNESSVSEKNKGKENWQVIKVDWHYSQENK